MAALSERIRFLNDICDAFGLPMNVRSIVLKTSVDEAPTLIVEHVVKEPPGQFKVVLKKYEITEKPTETTTN